MENFSDEMMEAFSISLLSHYLIPAVENFCDEFGLRFPIVSTAPMSVKIRFKGYLLCGGELYVDRMGHMESKELLRQLNIHAQVDAMGGYKNLYDSYMSGVLDKTATLSIYLAKMDVPSYAHTAVEETYDGCPMIMALIIGKEGILHKKRVKNIYDKNYHCSGIVPNMPTMYMSPYAIITKELSKLVVPAINDFVKCLAKKPFLLEEGNPISQVYRRYEGNLIFDEHDDQHIWHTLDVAIFSGDNIVCEQDCELYANNWRLYEKELLLDDYIVNPISLDINIPDYKMDHIVENMAIKIVESMREDQNKWLDAGMLVATAECENISGFTVEISICGDPADFADSKDYDPRFQEECDNGFKREALYLFNKRKEPMLRYTWVE